MHKITYFFLFLVGTLWAQAKDHPSHFRYAVPSHEQCKAHAYFNAEVDKRIPVLYAQVNPKDLQNNEIQSLVRGFFGNLKESATKEVSKTFNNIKKATKKTNNLEKVTREDLKSKGLVGGVMGGLALLYETISNVFIYPILAILFLLMTIVLIALIVRIILKMRRDDTFSVRKALLYIFIYLLIYFDLFLIIYEEKRITVLFLSFEKDTILIVLSALIGFFIGKMTSKRTFEEKALP